MASDACSTAAILLSWLRWNRCRFTRDPVQVRCFGRVRFVRWFGEEGREVLVVEVD